MNTSDAKIIWMGGRTSGGGAQQHFDFFSFYHFFIFFKLLQLLRLSTNCAFIQNVYFLVKQFM